MDKTKDGELRKCLNALIQKMRDDGVDVARSPSLVSRRAALGDFHGLLDRDIGITELEIPSSGTRTINLRVGLS